MRVIVRNTNYEKQHLWFCYQPKFFVYEGEQVPAFKWNEPGTICLTTSDPSFPVRCLSLKDIVSIDDAPVETPKQEKQERVFLVQGSKGSTYTVTISPSARSCTCSGFQFRHNCRHINEALAA